MDRGAWQATVHGATKGQTQLSHFHFNICQVLEQCLAHSEVL